MLMTFTVNRMQKYRTSKLKTCQTSDKGRKDKKTTPIVKCKIMFAFTSEPSPVM
jgi:hypothetical protein